MDEILKAEKVVIRWMQQEAFPRELQCLQKGQDLPKKCTLKSLHPFLDQDDLIRVGGRISNSEIPWERKHQIVLPDKHFITNIIMRKEHLRLKHCPPEQLLNEVRQKFWPVSGRREAHKVTKKCIRCFCFNPTIPNVIMGDLPRERVQGYIRPITFADVDYAGSFQVRESRRRGRVHISKGYVAVFTCFNTKAVHLELVTELTTQAFFAALQRFTARRGICTRLSSDNGLNFVGAAGELKKIQEFLTKNSPEIINFLAKQQIN